MKVSNNIVCVVVSSVFPAWLKTIPVTPPTVKRNKNPIDHNIGVLNSTDPPHIVAIHEKIFIPVGTAMTIVASIK